MVTSFDHPWINREERILEFWPQMGCVGGCYIFRYTVGWQSNVHSSFSTSEFLADFHLVSFLGSGWVLLSLLLEQLEYPRSQTLESACLGNFRQVFHFSLSVFSSIKKWGMFGSGQDLGLWGWSPASGSEPSRYSASLPPSWPPAGAGTPVRTYVRTLSLWGNYSWDLEVE